MAYTKESLVFVINVGVTSKDSQPNPVFLEKTKKIVQRLIEKKIFYRPKDNIGLLLYGSTTTLNDNNFKNIEKINNDSQCVMQVPNWDLIQFVSDLKLTDCVSNWIKALYVAIDLINRESGGLELLNNITEDTITFSESLIVDICKQSNGIYRTINEAVDDTRFIKKTQSKLQAWSCDFELLDVKIPIKSYVMVTNEARLPFWKTMTNKTSDCKTIELNEPVEAEYVTEYHGRHREIHNAKDTTHGYNYGDRFISFSKEDEEAMMYKSGPMSYKFICFTKKKHIGMQYWSNSTSTRIVIPAIESVAPKFYSLMEAMNKKNVVAIVRKVYRRNLNPNIVALFPRMNTPDEPWCFVEIILPYAENTRLIESKPLTTSYIKKLSKEQNDVVDNLLDVFMLNDISDSSITKKEKSFMPGCVPNPMRQNTFNMLSYRALNPEQPLPSVDIELKKLLEPCQEIKERLIDPIEKIKKLFKLPDPTTEKIETFKDLDNTQSKEQPSNVSKNNNTAVDDDSFEEMIAPSDVLDVDIDPLVNIGN
ncbi:hypothetical protein M0802_008358 [Mischocyttarus mexicanus]|nr:hypothetical protein M0802_008358 [Mischocyttarus mexicanus]